MTILTKARKKARSFGKEGTKDGELKSPRGVAITADGHILVTDLHRIQKFTMDGVCVKSVNGSGLSWAGPKQLRYPTSITFESSMKQILVADSDNNRVRVFTNDLTLICTISQYGSSSEQQLNTPYDVAVDADGYMHVCS